MNSVSPPPLVILHGLFGSGRNWRTVAEIFAASRRVLTPDLPGHGSHPAALPADIPGLAAGVAALLDREAIPRADLLGHSLGGKTAAWLALAHPQRVRRLLVVDIAPVPYPGHQPGFLRLLDALQALPLEQVHSHAEADARLTAAIPEKGLRQFLLQNLLRRDGRYAWRIDLARFRAALPGMVGFPATDGVPPFADPALFLGGARSDYLLPEHAPLIRRLFPRAEIRHLADAGHWPHVEQQEAFLHAVTEFLSATEKPEPV
jgi:pimeloyl-ACP methyl ester carboxylesterase